MNTIAERASIAEIIQEFLLEDSPAFLGEKTVCPKSGNSLEDLWEQVAH